MEPSTPTRWRTPPPTGGQGHHAHVLLHLPADRHAALQAALAAHLTAAFAWHPRRPSDVPLDIAEKVLEPDDTARPLVYALKGIDPRVTTYCRPRGEGTKPQGTIDGKRAGLSQSIDQSARQRAGHTDTAKLSDLDLSNLTPTRRKVSHMDQPVTAAMLQRQIAIGAAK